MTVAIQPISIIIGIYREETLMTSNMEILPDDGTAVLFTVSETLGMHFWIDEDDNLFIFDRDSTPNEITLNVEWID